MNLKTHGTVSMCFFSVVCLIPSCGKPIASTVVKDDDFGKNSEQRLLKGKPSVAILVEELRKNSSDSVLDSQLNADEHCLFVGPLDYKAKYSFSTSDGMREFSLLVDFLSAVKVELGKKGFREVVFVSAKTEPTKCVVDAVRELADLNGLRVSKKFYTNME